MAEKKARKAGKEKVEEKFAGAVEASKKKTESKTPKSEAKPKAEGDGEDTVLDEDGKGNRFLPGQEIIVTPDIKKMVNKVKEIETVLKKDFAKARDALTAAQEEVSTIAHENMKVFSPPDAKGKRTFKAMGVTVELSYEKEKITTKLDKDKDETK